MYGRKAAEEWEGSKSEGMEEEDGRSNDGMAGMCQTKLVRPVL